MTHTQRNVLAAFLPFLVFCALLIDAERAGKLSEGTNLVLVEDESTSTWEIARKKKTNLVLAAAEDSASGSDSSTSASPHPLLPGQRVVKSGEWEDLPFVRNKAFWYDGSCRSMMQTFVTLQPVRINIKYIEEVLKNWEYGSGWFPAFEETFINTNDTSPWSSADAEFEQTDDGFYWKPGIHFILSTRHLQHHERLLVDCGFSLDKNISLSTSPSCRPHKKWFSKLQDESASRFDFHSKEELKLMQSTAERQKAGEDVSGLPYGAGSKYELLPLKISLFLCVGAKGSEWTPVQMFLFSLSEGTKNASQEFWSDELVRDVDREAWTPEPGLCSTMEIQRCGPEFKDGPCVWKVRQLFKSYKTIDASSLPEPLPESAAAASHLCGIVVFSALLATALPMLSRQPTG